MTTARKYREGLRKCRYVLKMMSREVPPADLAMPWLPTAQTGPRNMLQNSYQNITTLTQPLSVPLAESEEEGRILQVQDLRRRPCASSR